MRVIPTKVHGVLDYILGLALFFAPEIFQFGEVGGAAVAIPRILGIATIIYSLITHYEWGIAKILPMSAHLALDMMAAILLIISPFLFGFVDAGANAWLPHIIVGVLELLVATSTQTEPSHHMHDSEHHSHH